MLIVLYTNTITWIGNNRYTCTCIRKRIEESQEPHKLDPINYHYSEYMEVSRITVPEK